VIQLVRPQTLIKYEIKTVATQGKPSQCRGPFLPSSPFLLPSSSPHCNKTHVVLFADLIDMLKGTPMVGGSTNYLVVLNPDYSLVEKVSEVSSSHPLGVLLD